MPPEGVVRSNQQNNYHHLNKEKAWMNDNLDCVAVFCAYRGFQGSERKAYRRHIDATAQ